jgi:hypothetical protein
LFDTVLVTSRRDLRSFNREQETDGPSAAESPVLDDHAREQFEKITHVLEVYPDIRFCHRTALSGQAASHHGCGPALLG